MQINPEIIRYYTNSRIELIRLNTSCQFEKVRTQQIISSYLTKTRAKILDVGGGIGTYSLWLSEMGHEAHMIDPVALHIGEARKASQQSSKPLATVTVGEARSLEFEDDYFDVVLLLGPLYHLTQKEERMAALLEAKRVTRKGGIIMCAVISRYAFLFDVLFHDIMKLDHQTLDSIERHMKTGQLRNPGETPDSLTTAYAHQPGELKEEVIAAGLDIEKVIAIDGFGWVIPGFDQKWQQDDYRESLLKVSQSVEADESILGISAHIMAVATKPS